MTEIFTRFCLMVPSPVPATASKEQLEVSQQEVLQMLRGRRLSLLEFESIDVFVNDGNDLDRVAFVVLGSDLPNRADQVALLRRYWSYAAVPDRDIGLTVVDVGVPRPLHYVCPHCYERSLDRCGAPQGTRHCADCGKPYDARSNCVPAPDV